MAKRKLDDKQKKDIVKHSLQQARQTLLHAELVNKGAYVHHICSIMAKIRELLKDKNTKVWGSKEFLKLCKLKQALMADLFMNEKRI